MRVVVFLLLPALTLPALSFRSLPAPGGIERVELGVEGDRSPKAWLGEQPLRVEQDGQGQWVALVGLDLALDVKQTQVVRVQTADGSDTRATFDLRQRDYPTQHITVDEKRHVRPDERELERIKKERSRLEAAYERFSPERMAPLDFKKPVGGRISGVFGLRRFFNGEPRSRHHGLDIAAARHSPIGAPQKGEVVLTDDFFFCGRTVLLDHGQGLLSLYCHLEEITVASGQRVAQGEVIGTVGSSGRATGPHLHWGVRLNGVWVDPALLLDR